MALDVIQINGCYVSSSLPKPLSWCEPRNTYKTNLDRFNRANTDCLKLKSKLSQNEPKCGGSATSELRQHLAVQTDLYVEELCEVIEEVDVACETDFQWEWVSPPVFVAQKTGVDAGTQILFGDLSNMNEEEMVAEDLVDKTRVDAITELLSEDPLNSMNKGDYQMKRNLKLAVLEALDNEERQLLKEKQIKLQEQEESILLDGEIAQKIAACVFSQSYLTDMVPQVYNRLENEGYFEEPELDGLEDSFWPSLVEEIDSEIATLEASYKILDALSDNDSSKLMHQKSESFTDG